MLLDYIPWPDSFAHYYRQAGYWRGETFSSMLRERALKYGDKTALVSSLKRWSYQDLDQHSEQLVAGLAQLGLKSGDKVVMQLPNCGEFFELCFALFRLGALPVFALPAHRQVEIGYFCQFTEAVAYIIPDTHNGFDYRPLARQMLNQTPTLRHVIVVGASQEFTALSDLYLESSGTEGGQAEPRPDDVAFFQLSGGSTGVPKLIPRTHDDYLYSVRASAEICGLDETSVYLTALPASHNFPLSSPGSLGTLYVGGKVVLATHPNPDETFPLIEREQVTITALVPPLALIWLEAASSTAYDLSSLKLLQVGGAKLNPEVAHRIQPILGCQLQQVYGMAEGLVCYTRLEDSLAIVINTQGCPISPDDELRIVDELGHEVAPGEQGELLTRGPYTIRGYYHATEHNAQAFTADGFYRTGDLVRLTPFGHLVVEGRVKDQINRGGEKIAAAEVENHLLAHDAVHDAAVIAIPDKFLGERTCAFIIPKAERPRAINLTMFLRQRGLAAYKIPDRVEFINVFPMTSVGKVNKKALRELIVNSNEF